MKLAVLLEDFRIYSGSGSSAEVHVSHLNSLIVLGSLTLFLLPFFSPSACFLSSVWVFH